MNTEKQGGGGDGPMKVIDKIRKLQRHAASAASIGNMAEAEAFAARVQELLIKHKLEQSDVERTTGEESQMTAFALHPEAWTSKLSLRRMNWAEELAMVVSEAHFCRMGLYAGSNVLLFFGRKSDVDVTVHVFCQLARAAQEIGAREVREAKKLYKAYMRVWPGTKAFLHSFYTGFTGAIYKRYLERQQETEEVRAHALVLKRESDAVEEFRRQFTSKEAKPLKRPDWEDNAIRAGIRAGEKVNINKSELLKGAD